MQMAARFHQIYMEAPEEADTRVMVVRILENLVVI